MMYERKRYRRLSLREIQRRRQRTEKILRVLSYTVVFTILIIILIILLVTDYTLSARDEDFVMYTGFDESEYLVTLNLDELDCNSVLIQDMEESCYEKEIQQISYTYDEEIMMRYIVECEAYDLSIEHKTIIACVILNRLESDLWDYESISDVILDEDQFSSLFNYYDRVMEPNQDTINAVSSVLNNRVDRDEISQGAIFFYNPDRSGGYIDFFEEREFLFEMDGHRFFR